MVHADEAVQNVIDIYDQVKFKVLLANWWSPSSEVGSDRSAIKKGNEKR